MKKTLVFSLVLVSGLAIAGAEKDCNKSEVSATEINAPGVGAVVNPMYESQASETEQMLTGFRSQYACKEGKSFRKIFHQSNYAIGGNSSVIGPLAVGISPGEVTSRFFGRNMGTNDITVVEKTETGFNIIVDLCVYEKYVTEDIVNNFTIASPLHLGHGTAGYGNIYSGMIVFNSSAYGQIPVQFAPMSF